MPRMTKIADQETPKLDVEEMLSPPSQSFRVILEEIRPEVETLDSFSLKLSLLTRTPVSRMKHVASRLPAVVWSGEGRRKAEHVLKLIEEAGGRGKIIEKAAAPPPAAQPREPKASCGATGPQASDVSREGEAPPEAKRSSEPKGAVVCAWCGFPLKEGDTRCEFCLTRVGANRGQHAVRSASHGNRPLVTVKRLVLYGVILLAAGIVVIILTR